MIRKKVRTKEEREADRRTARQLLEKILPCDCPAEGRYIEYKPGKSLAIGCDCGATVFFNKDELPRRFTEVEFVAYAINSWNRRARYGM